MDADEQLKRADQIRLLEAALKFTDTGEWVTVLAYPSCRQDLVAQGLATETREITTQGRAALWLLGKAPDTTSSKAVEVIRFTLRSGETENRVRNHRNRLQEIVASLEKEMQCNCDLDNWEPEKSTGHSWVCRIHKEAFRLLGT